MIYLRLDDSKFLALYAGVLFGAVGIFLLADFGAGEYLHARVAQVIGAFLAITGMQVILWAMGIRLQLLGTVGDETTAEAKSVETESETTANPLARLSEERALELFKFYEEAANKAKEHAWAATTWILALNAGVLGFALDYFGRGAGKPEFSMVEAASALVGIGLCGFLIYLLHETGRHISNYWTTSNKIAASHTFLEPFIGRSTADEVRTRAALYAAPFPSFCLRLQLLAILFAVVHLGSAYLLIQHAAHNTGRSAQEAPAQTGGGKP